jgi:glutathione S-transferase
MSVQAGNRVRLVIGNKNYSSWSLRAWLALRKTGTEFEEICVSLYVPGHRETLLAHAPSGKVPVYVEDGLTVWDSLAILEYLAERHRWLWPADRSARATARSLCAEMHSGFRALRTQFPMNCRAAPLRRVLPDEEAAGDIARIQAAWMECRDRCTMPGPWLFGTFTNADAMFAPVALRFATYGVALEPPAAAYVATVLADPDIKAWSAAAALERETIAEFERGGV